MNQCIRMAALAAIVLATSTTAVAAGKRAVTIKGSDTMVILGQRWAERYMTTHPGALLQITGGGSGTGIAALINGNTDICQASRPMKPDEKKKLRDRYQTTGVEIPVARDGLSIYVHEANPLAGITVAQLKDIYTGKVTNWKDLGGKDEPIVVYSRESSSGTYVYFKDNVLDGEDFAPQVQTLPGTAAIVNAISKDPRGIGYGGVAYAKGIRIPPLKRDAADPGVIPSEATVRDGSYALARDLYFYTRKKPDGAIKAFIDWVLSPEGQQLVTEVGYFPVK
ncbi:MAG: phosphate ABC transporter substrate-binding protein [Candidatus Eisenbacteria bacterium]|nr:phosphate ABC transporter substrate-binding protein [Candidatus Eisenbacteria bacterium]